MSHKHHRENKAPSSSHMDLARMTIRQAFNNSPNTNNESKNDYDLNLYEHNRQERINEIADDEDGDLIVERQLMPTEKTSRTIEANDRRHDAVIFGDKTIEEQQKNQLWDSFKQSSKYSTTSLAGPLLLEDSESKRLRWKAHMHELWNKRHNAHSIVQASDVEMA